MNNSLTSTRDHLSNFNLIQLSLNSNEIQNIQQVPKYIQVSPIKSRFLTDIYFLPGVR